MADTLALLRRLIEGGVEFIVIGGVAAVAHGSPVATDDIVICAPIGPENLVRIIRALSDVEPHWRTRPDLPVIQPDASYLGQLKNAYLRTLLGPLDILGEIPGVCSYEQAARSAISMDLNGLSCRVIDLETLIASKRFAGRDHDLRTVDFLEQIKGRGQK